MSNQQLTVTESVELYLTMRASKSKGYVADMAQTLRMFAKSVGPILVKNLTPVHVNKAFDEWVLKGNLPSTLNKKRAHVGCWLDYASRRRHMRRTPQELMEGVEKRQVIPRQRTRLNASELLGLLDFAEHPRDRAYAALAMNTALRANELTTLLVSDCDLANGVLHVLRHKTGTRDQLPITADLDAELRRWLTWYSQHVKIEDHFLLVPAKESPRLNCRYADIYTPLRPTVRIQQPQRLIQRMLIAAGIERKFEGVHTIRRSVARVSYDYYCEQGETRDDALSVVQATLGHSSQAITERYIGVERFKEKRDRAMKGRPFLSAMVDQSNVRRLHG